jgi:hypothetical protein
MSERQNSGCFLRQTLIGCVFIILGTIICSIGTTAAIDVACASDIGYKMPLYPGAEIIGETRGFFRTRAMGRSELVLRTPDSAETVRKWYDDYRHSITRSTVDEEDRSATNMSPGGLATVSMSTAPDAETGQTRIYLRSDCAYN